MIIKTPRPTSADMPTLHAEIDVMRLGSYSIQWHDDELWLVFDDDLSATQERELRQVVTAHDGTAAIAQREQEAAQIAAIQAANAALLESARAKRLAGVALSQAELAALVDSFIFPR